MRTQLSKILLGLAAVMLYATHALAAPPAAPPTLYMPATPTTSATFKVRWAAASGASSYVLEEATNATYSDAVVRYTGSTIYALRTVPASGTYYYRVKAVNVDGESAWTNAGAPTGVVVTLTCAPPTSVSLPATASDGTYKVLFGASPTGGVTYLVQEATQSNFSDAVQVAAPTIPYVLFKNKPAGTYYYRVSATKTGYIPSAFVPAGNSVFVTAALAPPGAISVGAQDINRKFKVLWGASPSGGSYTLEEADDAGFATNLKTAYTGTTTYAILTATTEGTRYYRVKTTVSGVDSAYATGSATVLLPAGSTYCITCHTTGGTATGYLTQGPAWQASRHANANAEPNPYTCTQCHNQLLQATAQIGCEGCHGVNGTTGHPAAGVLVNAQVVCGACHNSHQSAEAFAIGNKVAASKHANGRGHNTSAKCDRCHTTEGSIANAVYTGDKSIMVQLDGPDLTAGTADDLLPNITPDQGATCAACHDHTGGLRVVAGWDPNQNTFADQFDLCTSCHTLYRNDGSVVASDATNGFYHNTSWHRIIATTHIDDPATGFVGSTGETQSLVEGYVLRKTGTNPCFDCHGHELFTNTRYAGATRKSSAGDTLGTGVLLTADESKTSIHTDWAQSAHAGGLLKKKYAVARLADGQAKTDTVALVDSVRAAAADDASGIGWTHYNWDRSGRASCQRCHTATGASNFLSNPTGYVAANNSFAHLAGWTANPANGSAQNEVLYCWGCHSNAGSGALRDPGALNFTFSNGATASFPNVTASNVCVSCHTGRETGDSIKLSTANFANTAFINSHYLAAGGMVFNVSGYEYTGQVYNDLGYHKNAGVANTLGSGTSGPCVSCHMGSPNSHSYEVVAKDGTGAITAVTSTTCSKCHGGMTAAVLTSKEESFAATVQALKDALVARGIYYNKAIYPYFFSDAAYTISFTNWDGVDVDANPVTLHGKDVMGAAFNLNLIDHDPGAYAHNRAYAIKMINDSIDFLNDGLLDGDKTAASTLAAAGINTGVVNTGSSSVHLNAVTNANATYCASCHTANPHYGGNATNKPQYLATGAVCSDCHANNNISTNSALLEEYVVSPHGDASGVWTSREVNTSTTNTGRCQRCHTTRGYVNDLTVGGSGITFAPTDVNEVLACNGCHTSVDPAAGATRRVAAAYSGDWNVNSVIAAYTYPNAGDSNQCIRCHSARRGGANITTAATTTAHYFPAAAVVFAGTTDLINVTTTTTGGPAVGTKFTGAGYEFAGQANYSGLGSHKYVGIANYINSGTSGPCVTCHMSGSAGHTWEAVTKNEITDDITAVNSSACAGCHSGMTPAFLNTTKANFATALAELDTELKAKGFYLYTNGTFYTAAYVVGGTNTAVTNAYYVTQATTYGLTAKDLQGAAYNYWLFKYEGADPAAYVHNRTYALKLIADSLDYLDDGSVNGSKATSAAATQLVTYSEPHAPVTATASEANCGACHTSSPHYGGAVLTKAQYLVSTSANVTTCDDCHASGTVTFPSKIMKEFAESGHADANGDPWFHYDWRASNRASCARCHNATAYVAKLGIETDVTNIFNAGDINLPNEVLKCSACHSNVTTGAIQPAALNQYTETYTDGGTFTFPNVGKSNLCLRCHSGRESGGTIKNNTDADGVLSFVNSHYLAAGGTLFTTTGYTYTGLSYNNPAGYLHNVAGITTPGSPLPSDRGPCSECHMGSATANHTWEPVVKDGSGVIISITSTGCADCHSGAFAMTTTLLNTANTQYQASLAALDGALQVKGIYFYNANPYFYTAPWINYTPPAVNPNVAYTNWAGPYAIAGWKNTMGAAFNLNLLEHDPGAYAHNSRYTRRLLRDSIDFIDDGVATNNSVPATLTSLQSAGKITAQQASDALTYLGATRP